MASAEGRQRRVLALAGARDPLPGEVRQLRLLDRRGPATATPQLIEVVVSAACPVCSKARGEPQDMTIWDVRSQTEFVVSRWSNPCGHVDLHADVVEEAERFRLERSA